MFLRFLVFRAQAAVIALVMIAVPALAQDAPSATHNEVLIRNAVIMTATLWQEYPTNAENLGYTKLSVAGFDENPLRFANNHVGTTSA